MKQIIYDGTKIKIYEALGKWCERVQKDEEFMADFWRRILEHEPVYNEFVHYLRYHELLANYTIEGYSMIDLFVSQMDQYNILHDTGKNGIRCNKEKMVLQAFYVMLKMEENPEEIIKRLQSGEGLDKM